MGAMEPSKLNDTFLFQGLSFAILDKIAGLSRVETFKTNEHIFEEGDPGDKFYVILSGRVRISKEIPGMGEEALAVLEKGEYFGEMALIDDVPRSADAIADCDVVVSIIEQERFIALLQSEQELAYELLSTLVKTLTARLRETNSKMTFLAAVGRFV